MEKMKSDGQSESQPPSPETLRFLHKSHSESQWQLANFVSKGLAFYLVGSAATVGYVLTQELPPPLQRQILGSAIAMTLLFFVAFTLTVRALLLELRSLVKLTHQLAGSVYNGAGLSTVDRSKVTATKLILLCTYVVGVLFLGALVALYVRASG